MLNITLQHSSSITKNLCYQYHHQTKALLASSPRYVFLHRQQHYFHHNEANNNNHNNNLSVAIVGSGPSGFYSAKYLQLAIQRAKQQQQQNIQEHCGEKSASKSSIINSLQKVNIDLIDRLPTPFGLVRSGVAPDHPEVKNVENDFIALIQKDQKDQNDNNISSSIEFRGNVHVGKDISLQELRDLYDVVILSYGCESDKKLGIEHHLKGVYSAREFVAWYNGHPDYVHMSDTFREMLGDGHPETSHVVVIGQGNVALDCARILAKGRNNLVDTDIASHALPILKDGVKQTTVIGRRGHVQGAFTIKVSIMHFSTQIGVVYYKQKIVALSFISCYSFLSSSSKQRNYVNLLN